MPAKALEVGALLSSPVDDGELWQWVLAKETGLLLLFLTLVANPKKPLYTVANPARGLLNREKKKKEKVWQPPPLLPRARSEKNKRLNASTCLGAMKVGVTQVVSVRLASVQGFLRLVS